MTRTGVFCLALALLCGGAAHAQTSERAGLRWDLKSGDELHYAFSWKFRQKQSIVGQMDLQDMTIKVAYTLTERVQKVEDGLTTIEATVTSVSASIDATMMGMPMGEMRFESQQDADEKNPLRVIRHVVGKTFRFKLSPTGAVTDVNGGKAIREAVAEAARTEVKPQAGGAGGGMGGGMGMGMDPATMARMFADQLTVAFADETLQSTLDVVTNVLPESGAAAQGETWTRDVVERLPKLGSLNFKAKYKHEGAVGDSTRITFLPEGAMKLEREAGAGDEGNPMAAMERQLLRGLEVTRTDMSGTSTFGKGKMIDSEVTQEIDSEGPLPQQLKMMMGGQPDAKMSMTTGLTLRYELQDGPPAAAKGEGEKKADDDDARF